MRRPIIGDVRDDGATPRPRRRARARRVLGQKSLEIQGDETAERVLDEEHDDRRVALKDLWRYDLVWLTWSEMYPAVAPSSRYLHNMAAWPGGHAIVLFGGEHIKSRKSGKKKYARLNDVWAFSAQTRNWTNLIADADEPEIQAATGLPACLANDSVQLAIALVVAFLVTGAALRARFRHDDAYDGPPGVQASPYVGV